MGFLGIPVAEWSTDHVVAWLQSLPLPQLETAFRENGVVGTDLQNITMEDLTGSLGCSPFQAKKLLTALAKLQGQPALDVQLQPAASAPAAMGYPPPATAAHPPAAGAEPPPSPLGASGPQQRSPPMGVAAPTPSQSMQLQPSAGSNVEELRQQLEAEKLKNERLMQQQSSAHLAAVAAPAPAPGPTAVYMYPPMRERYCGPISWVVGICLLPCIFLCPIDERDVYPMGQQPVAVVAPMQPPAVAVAARHGQPGQGPMTRPGEPQPVDRWSWLTGQKPQG